MPTPLVKISELSPLSSGHDLTGSFFHVIQGGANYRLLYNDLVNTLKNDLGVQELIDKADAIEDCIDPPTS